MIMKIKAYAKINICIRCYWKKRRWISFIKNDNANYRFI